MINRRIRMPLKFTMAVAMLMFACLPGIAAAQINEQFSDLEPYIDEARAVMATDRKVLIRRRPELLDAVSRIHGRYGRGE
jgi:hypothetical protein